MSLPPPGLLHRAVGILSVCAFLGLSTLLPAHAKHEHEDDENLADVAAPESTEPRLSVPEYRSPLSTYLSFEDAEPRDWKEANDRVGELGGWLFYSREAFRSNKAKESENVEKEKKSE